jgi:phage N-6-adenine-methyltransferase
MFSSKTDMWFTPQEFFDKLNQEFNFTLDVCAIPENAKCESFFTPEMNSLKQEWTGVCWCNPPYGRELGKWVEKAYIASTYGTTVVMLIPARTDTQWFHKYIYNKENVEIRFVKGRLKFGGGKKCSSFSVNGCYF